MPSGVLQRSFAGGEITAAAGARADMVKYATGLDRLRNGFIMKYGGVANRSGTKFITEVKDSTKATVLIPFIFNDAQTYMLEFGEFYMRVIYQDAQVVVDAGAVIAWSALTDYTITNIVSKGGFFWYALYASGPGTDIAVAKDPETTTGFWYQMPADGTYEIPTPYTEADLTEINYDQSADVVELVHRSQLPYTLSRTDHTAWTLSPTRFIPTIFPPAYLTATQAAVGNGIDHRYKVTAVKKKVYEESYVGRLVGSDQTALTVSHGANDLVLDSTAHGLTTGEEVFILTLRPTGVGAINGDLVAAIYQQVFNVTVIDVDTFSLDETSGVDYTVEHEVEWLTTVVELLNGSEATEANPVTVTWQKQAVNVGVGEYWVYKEKSGIFGYIGNAAIKENGSGDIEFLDTGQAPNLEEVPPSFSNQFVRENKRPGVVAYFNQRLCYASSNDDPQTVWMSRAGNFRNFTIRSPLQDDDSIQFTIAGREVNEVRQLVGLGKYLMLLTRGATWIARGDGDGVIRPSAINLSVQDQDGASTLRPMIIGNTALYLQARGAVIRDLSFSIEVDGYEGRDLTIFAQHLFGNGQRSCAVVSWAFAQIPHGIVWVVLDDGSLLGLTYLREHEIWGWHKHSTTHGLFEWVATIPNNDLDEPYFVVKRTLPSGAEKRYIEKLNPRCLACGE